MLCLLIRIETILISTHNIPFSIEKIHKIILNLQRRDFSKGLKNEFETAMVNEPSVFEPLKVNCTYSSRICRTMTRKYIIGQIGQVISTIPF